MTSHGFSQDQWSRAKEEAKSILIERSRDRGMIPYSELVSQISAITLEAYDIRLNNLLSEISREEDEAGRGMLSVIVVHRQGDMEPGRGFYELAKSLGRDVSNETECWVKELHRVHAQWSR